MSALLLWAVGAMAQTDFAVRIIELSSSTYTCTAVTQDGRLRREVTSTSMGQTSSPEIFEGLASEDDRARLKSLIADPDFQAASRQNKPGLSMASPQGRIVAVEASFADNREETVAFSDAYGKTSAPACLARFLSFAE
jgi:hypothetical protein